MATECFLWVIVSFCTNPSRKINTGRNIQRTTIPLSWKRKIKWHSIFYPPNANFGNQHDNTPCHEIQPVMVSAEAVLAPDRGSWAGLCVSASSWVKTRAPASTSAVSLRVLPSPLAQALQSALHLKLKEKSPVQCPHLQFSLWNRLSNQCGGKKKSLTSELNPITMNFNYSKSSLDLTFIESNAEVNGLALGLRSRVRPFCWSCKVFTMGFDF